MVTEIYQTHTGRRPYIEWLGALSDLRTQVRVEVRLRRLSLDHWGDHKQLGNGLIEIRLHFGSGYRVYCSQVKDNLVILLCGGSKRNQRGDIQAARRYLKDYRERP